MPPLSSVFVSPTKSSSYSSPSDKPPAEMDSSISLMISSSTSSFFSNLVVENRSLAEVLAGSGAVDAAAPPAAGAVLLVVAGFVNPLACCIESSFLSKWDSSASSGLSFAPPLEAVMPIIGSAPPRAPAAAAPLPPSIPASGGRSPMCFEFDPPSPPPPPSGGRSPKSPPLLEDEVDDRLLFPPPSELVGGFGIDVEDVLVAAPGGGTIWSWGDAGDADPDAGLSLSDSLDSGFGTKAAPPPDPSVSAIGSNCCPRAGGLNNAPLGVGAGLALVAAAAAFVLLSMSKASSRGLSGAA
mmetsp:Transcript_4559/g.11153  ORF Transcript_4559/g.11153 Transcript_4559/m.11153 type:complete len:297 (+) Transcript_4559:427-1317(+)